MHSCQFSQTLRGKIPVNEVLSQAIDLLDQLKSDELCPHDIKVNYKTGGKVCHYLVSPSLSLFSLFSPHLILPAFLFSFSLPAPLLIMLSSVSRV